MVKEPKKLSEAEMKVAIQKALDTMKALTNAFSTEAEKADLAAAQLAEFAKIANLARQQLEFSERLAVISGKIRPSKIGPRGSW